MITLPGTRFGKQIRSLRIPSTQLYFFVVFVSLFIMTMGVIGIRRMHTIYRNAHTLYADRTLPLEQLNEIRAACLDNLLGTIGQLETGKLNTSQAIARIHIAESRIRENWITYRLTYLTPNEKKFADSVGVLLNQLSEQISALVPALQQSQGHHQKEIAESIVGDTIRKFLGALKALIGLQVQIGRQLEANNTELYENTSRQFYISLALALALIAILSIFLIRNIQQSFRRLQKNQQQVLEEQEKTQAFLDLAGDMIFIVRPDYRIAYVNQIACSKLGYHREEVQSKNIYELFAGTESPSFTEVVNRMKAEKKSIHTREFLKKDGTTLFTESSVRLLPDGSYINIARDQTEKRQALTALRESEEKYRYLFQNSPACIIIWDLINLSVLEVNKAVIQKYGYPEEEWIGMSVFRYRPKEDHSRIRQFAASLLKSGEKLAKSTWKHLKYSGEEMWMEIVSHRIDYKGVPAILSLGIDITEQVKMQLALRKSEDLFHSMVDYAGEAIFMVNRTGLIIDVNRKARE
ncbi:MAG TPA: PAS domain S-box protein, partial [Sediminibacterium sp.]|nr:PAS domain S-box protein [Sediminibacterium sp.]